MNAVDLTDRKFANSQPPLPKAPPMASLILPGTLSLQQHTQVVEAYFPSPSETHQHPQVQATSRLTRTAEQHANGEGDIDKAAPGRDQAEATQVVTDGRGDKQATKVAILAAQPVERQRKVRKVFKV